MKKSLTAFLLLWMALTGASFVGNSQNTDTICLPLPQVKKVLADARQKPLLLEKINLLQADIRIMEERIAAKESIINNMERDQMASQEIIDQLKEEKKLYEEQKKIMLNQARTFEKLLKKEKRKRRWTAFTGMLTTGIVTYLFITK
jgi:chromosome segregation ATPase